jgi:uncharacterized protein YcgI (DUF1989 family)
MSESTPETTHYELTAADADRLQELSREVRGRLMEIAQIAARPVGVQVQDDSIIKFGPRGEGSAVDAGDWVEIIDVDGHEVCYGEIDGVPFSESPCGAATTARL